MKLNQPLVLALSGGPDSVYLLYKLLEQGHHPILAHFNHHLRGKESDNDEHFVRELAKQHHLTLEVGQKNVAQYATQKKISIETAARELRYVFLEKIRQKHRAAAILTAHHLDDNLETMLMNRLRGSNLRGHIGMREHNGKIVRPLLEIPKIQILSFLKRHRLPYRLDASNKNLRYRRNWIRHILIPRLLKKNPDLYENFRENRKNALKEYERLTAWAGAWFKKNPDIPLRIFSRLSLARQRFLLQHLYQTIYHSTKGLKKVTLEEVRHLLLRAQTGKQKKFGKQAVIWTKKGEAKITIKDPLKTETALFSSPR